MLTATAASIWACAKGTAITDTEIVYLSLQPAPAADAGADAGGETAAPAGASASDQRAP